MKLPELQARPQRAERASLAAVRPTDLGLGGVARDAAEWEAEVEETRRLEEDVQRANDEDAVRPMLDELREGFETRFNQAGAEWDGVSAGWARGIQAELTERMTPLRNREDLTPGQRDALERGLAQYSEATTQNAIQYQARRRGQLAAEQAAARQATEVGGYMAGYTEAFGAMKAKRDADYDGSQPDYTAGVLQDHDATAAEIIARAPEHLKPRLMQQMATRRLTLLGQAMDIEARGEEIYVAGQVASAGDRLVNGVLTAPSLYESALQDLPQVVAGLPGARRRAATADMTDALTEAYVSGLIREGQHDLALKRLNSGDLDARLKPDTKDRLLSAATRKRDELSVDDWMDRLSLQALMQDDLTSRAATGQGVEGVDPGRVAAVLGEREAAEYMLAVGEAQKAHQALAGFAQMTPGQIRDQVESLKPEPGQADYADQQRRYQAASQAAEAEIKARQDDPAAWALRQSPAQQARLQALGQGDAATARRTAGAYGIGQLTLQETAGVPSAQRRLLPAASAKAIVEAATANPDPGQGLRGLGAVIEAFAPPPGADGTTIRAATARQSMVISELKAAGADNGDLAAAVDLADDPVRLGRYIAATRRGALEAMKPTERETVAAATDRALGAYLRSFDGLPVNASLTGGRRLMAQRMAAERMAAGASVQEAAREAAGILNDRYVFVGAHGFRVPKAVADRDTGLRLDGGGASVDIRRGSAAELSALTRNDGAGFFAPADNGGGLSEAQRRQRYADSVARSGRWVTTPDDGGLILMQPTLDGGWTPALDRGGRAVVRTWDQLINAARPAARPGGTGPRQTGGQGAGRTPIGIRNHNPGNIRPDGRSQWQGAVGVDRSTGGAGFIRFATPEHGLRALSRDLGTKMERGKNTIRSILTAYAPETENDTEAYIRAVAGRLGLDPNARLDPADVRLRAGLMGAIIQHENGAQPYAPALIAEAARQGMRR